MPLILMYHRIADEPVDPWGLAVSAGHFEEQLDVLRRTRHPLHVTDFVTELIAGTLPAHAVALSFDDGYADNFFAAKPRLAAADVPATVFLATGYLSRPGEFWWDEIARLTLLEDGPRGLDLLIRGRAVHFELGTEPPPREERTWRGWSPPPTRRHEAYLAVWDTLRRLEDDERQAAMAKLRAAFTSRHPRAGSGRPMTVEEVKALVTDGLVRIGAHTVTHPTLTELDAAARHREIALSRAACEALVGAPVTAFSYPHGAFDAEVRGAVGAAGFTSALCSADGPATSASDPLALPRMQIFDWDGDAFDRALWSVSAGG